MKAAVITSLDKPPQYADFVAPRPQSSDEMLVDVLAVGLHHITRGQASGTHYSSAGALSRVAGVDGVGRGADGKLRYLRKAQNRWARWPTRQLSN